MASVFITKRVNVYPKSMQPTKIMKLTNLDRQCSTLLYIVLFYNPSHCHNYNNDCVFSILKSSLEETLSVWYPAAGRMRKNPNNNGYKLDYLWCNNGGALMVEAVTSATLSEFGNVSEYNEFFENLVYKPNCNDENISEMPLLFAQVTKFGCGGYSVGIGTNHELFDGKSTFNFLSAWASNTQSHINNQEIIYKDAVDQQQKPVHERDDLLQLVTNCNNGGTLTNDTNSTAAALPQPEFFQHFNQLLTQAAPAGGMPNVRQPFIPTREDNYVLQTFHFTTSMIDALKRRAFDGRVNSYSWCSSFDIVTAHLWKARTIALGLRKERMVCLLFAIDIRSRVTPQLSQGFSGNAYVMASVALTAGEVEVASYETLVNKIRSAKNSVDNNYVSTYTEALQETSGTALPPLKELTIVSDWTRTPFHTINFNVHPNNKADVSACLLIPPDPQVAYFLRSPKEDKGIDVRLGLHSHILADFSHYFLNIS